MKCTIKCYNLCKIGVCQDGIIVNTPFVADTTGVYTVEYTYLSGCVKRYIQYAEDDEIAIPISCPNENYEYCLTITDPNGELVTFIEDEDEYGCIKFKTAPQLCDS